MIPAFVHPERGQCRPVVLGFENDFRAECLLILFELLQLLRQLVFGSEAQRLAQSLLFLPELQTDLRALGLQIGELRFQCGLLGDFVLDDLLLLKNAGALARFDFAPMLL